MSSPPQWRAKASERRRPSDSSSMSAVADYLKLRVTEEEEEEEEETMKGNTDLPKQTQDGPDAVSAVKQDPFESLREMYRRQVVLLLKETSCSAALEWNEHYIATENSVRTREMILDKQNHILEEFSNSTERKSADAKTLFEKESESIQEKGALTERLTDEAGVHKSELADIEKVLKRRKDCKNLLFTLMGLEWQEAPEAETVNAKVLSDRDAQNETAVSEGLERGPECRALPSTQEPVLSSAHSDTAVTNSSLDGNSTEYEDKVELYFSNPQHLQVLLSDLTDQALCLFQNSTRIDNTQKQTIEIARKKMEEDEERLMMQINDMEDRLDREEERVVTFRRTVQLHETIKSQDELLQDRMLDGLDRKVTQMHPCSQDSWLTFVSTLKKLSNVENQMALLLQDLEDMPEESLMTLRHIRDTERRTRQREEALRQEEEKHNEREKRCRERSLCDSKRRTGRMPISRCFPYKQRIPVSEEAPVPTEKDFYASLFTEDSE